MTARRGFTHCYACDFDQQPRGAGSALSLALLYEHIVEEVERYGDRPFTISGVWERACRRPVAGSGRAPRYDWQRHADGPSAYVLTRHVVHDLAAHGLVQCQRYDRVGRRCLEWRVTRPA